jgi:predicted butyrate kinase (DUF1464 family)
MENGETILRKLKKKNQLNLKYFQFDYYFASHQKSKKYKKYFTPKQIELNFKIRRGHGPITYLRFRL